MTIQWSRQPHQLSLMKTLTAHFRNETGPYSNPTLTSRKLPEREFVPKPVVIRENGVLGWAIYLSNRPKLAQWSQQPWLKEVRRRDKDLVRPVWTHSLHWQHLKLFLRKSQKKVEPPKASWRLTSRSLQSLQVPPNQASHCPFYSWRCLGSENGRMESRNLLTWFKTSPEPTSQLSSQMTTTPKRPFRKTRGGNVAQECRQQALLNYWTYGQRTNVWPIKLSPRLPAAFNITTQDCTWLNKASSNRPTPRCYFVIDCLKWGFRIL